MDKEELPRKTGAADPGGDKQPLWVNVSTVLFMLLILSPIISAVYHRVVYLPQPAYTVKAYEKLYDACAPYQMYLPEADALPAQEYTYTVYLATNQRRSQPTGYSIDCAAALVNDYPMLHYQVSCGSLLDQEPYPEYIETRNGIPIYGRFQRVFDTDDNPNWAYCDEYFLQFVLEEHKYTAGVQLCDSEEDRREALEKQMIVIARSIIDQSVMAE